MTAREPEEELERRALEAIDAEGLTSLARSLVAIPSLDGHESEAQRAVADWMRQSGLRTDEWRIDLDDLATHPAYSAEVDRAEALGVVGWTGDRKGGRDLLLNGHIDVVPPGDHDAWSVPPWGGVLRDGAVYGRGAVDMKGGLACALEAAAAIRRAGIRLRGRLSVASVVGEEDGGTGTLATLLRGHNAHGAVIVEPTDLHIVTAQAGALTFRLTVPGHSAHACARTEGVSAVEKFLPIFTALRQLEKERNTEVTHPAFARYELPWPLEIGTVRAGDWPSSVPERLVAEGRYGVAVGEDPAEARAALEAAVAGAARTDPWLRLHPPAVEWWGGRFEPASTDPGDPLVATLAASCRELTGELPVVEGVTYGADLRLLVNVGHIPTVLFGPGDVRLAHMPDERVEVSALHQTARVLVLTALRFCGCETGG